MFGGEYTQGTQANENYTVDLTNALNGDTVSSVAWPVASAPSGLTLSNPAKTSTTISSNFSGGANGIVYLIFVQVTTGTGNVIPVEIYIFINDA